MIWKLFKEIKDNGEKVLQALKTLTGRKMQKMRSRPQHYRKHIIYILHSLALNVPFSLLRHPKCAYGCSRETAERKIGIEE